MLAYVLQVKVEMELEIQQCEKTKAVREEQLERLTQICQEQAVSTKTLCISYVIIYSMCPELACMYCNRKSKICRSNQQRGKVLL